MTPGAFGTRAGKARLRDTAAPTKLFALKRKSKNNRDLTANTTNLGRTITKSGLTITKHENRDNSNKKYKYLKVKQILILSFKNTA